MYTLLLFLGFGLMVYGTILEKGEKKSLNIPFEETISGEFQDMVSQGEQDVNEEPPIRIQTNPQARLQTNFQEGLQTNLQEGLQTNLQEGEPSGPEWDFNEKPIFSEVLQQKMDQERARFLLDEREQAKERMRIIEGLDQGAYSVDLVCSLLNMEKGEVLLLKNISNKFGK